MEQWKEIPGYPDYQVSNQGEVASHKAGKTRILKATNNTSGYKAVGLCMHGVRKTFPVHKLVALCFLTEPPHAPEEYWTIDHLDGDRSNARASNLAIVRHRDNIHNPNTYPGWLQAHSRRKNKTTN